MKGITSHVLDTAAGRPAAGVAVRLECREGEAWRSCGEGGTDGDGRTGDLLSGSELKPGTYRLTFATGVYFAAREAKAFHPEVQIQFRVDAGQSHYHVPLLIAPFGYTTYRGT